MAGFSVGLMWGTAMVLSNVVLIPLDRTIYGTSVVVEGSKQKFRRPFFVEFVMFLAMMACLLFEIPAWRRQAASRKFWPTRLVCFKLFIPAFCDLLGSWLIFCGAIWVPASVVEMLSCSSTIFTALLSICFLKKRIARHEWLGIGLSVLGVIAVGVAHLASPNSETQQDSDESSVVLTVLGLALVVAAFFWYAVENVVTEKLLGEQELSGFQSAGVMGVWGTLIFLPLFLLLQVTPTEPAIYASMWHEEIGWSLSALCSMPSLFLAVVVLFVAFLFFNAASFKTIEHLSAMARVVIGSLSSPLVWALDLVVAGIAGKGAGAAEMLSIWSSLQLVGFILTLCGTLIYNEVHPFCRGVSLSSETTSAGVSLVEEAG